ncbi:adenylate cyclase [Rhodobacterales bacterium]|nr:adenylate cyclase [Rhodobacterales bacterium]
MQDKAEPTAPEIRDAVERIVASEDFKVPDRVVSFLRYVVDETLEGRSSGIKAYSVAIDVFGRDETFDPQSDPVVRIEAARLRRALERYYLTAGTGDPVVIGLPKGGYVPCFGYRFEPRESLPAEVAPRAVVVPRRPLAIVLILAILALAVPFSWIGYDAVTRNTATAVPRLEPKVLVLPFSNLGAEDMSAAYAVAITDELVGALSRFQEISVFGVQTSRANGGANVEQLRTELHAEYLLEGSARTDTDHVRVSARLIDTATRAVVWTSTYEHELTADALFRIPAETAAAVAGAVAQPDGVVFHRPDIADGKGPPDDLEAYFCSLDYYPYRNRPDPETHYALRACLERTVGQFPTYATALAMLSFVYVDELRHGFNRKEGAVVRAVEAARRAVSVDHDNARGLQALATALFFAGKPQEAFDYADRALAINPNDSDLLGQAGQIFGLSGQKTRGRALMEKALLLNPAKEGFYQGNLAFVCYLQEDYACATSAIEQSDAYQVPTYHGIAAIIYAQTGRVEEARKEAAAFQRIAPDFIQNLWGELSARNIPYEDQLLVADGLRKAGVVVPPAPATH